MEPFLKWAGGKRWFVQNYSHFFPKKYNRYIEPFLGSGAVFFHLQPQNSILADSNSELITTYQAVKYDWTSVYKKLRIHHHNHSSQYYYRLRSSRPRENYSRAARLIYLNRTCWNGLYRVNLKGEFNVPKGTKQKVILDTDNFENYSRVLKNTKLLVSDFERIIDCAERNDFLFVDPPYTVKHQNNGFIKYNEKLFCWEDQVRLKNTLLRAKKRGAKIITTNAYNKHIVDLYKKDFKTEKLIRISIISGKITSRKMAEELIAISF